MRVHMCVRASFKPTHTNMYENRANVHQGETHNSLVSIAAAWSIWLISFLPPDPLTRRRAGNVSGLQDYIDIYGYRYLDIANMIHVYIHVRL